MHNRGFPDITTGMLHADLRQISSNLKSKVTTIVIMPYDNDPFFGGEVSLKKTRL